MNDIHEQNTWVSKTAKKKEMNHLQDLGVELTQLSEQTLKKMTLPEDLYQAIRDYKKITANGALKRQRQYIGRLMREVNPEPIRAFLAQLKGENQAHNAFLQRIEQMRSRLLEHDDALTQFINDYPHADVAQLRNHIRLARREQERNQPPKHFRALYQTLKTVMNPVYESSCEAIEESEKHHDAKF